jgi:glycosyltransferase involved in cell wall biosynthesis
MKILIVSQYFWPENFRINDLVTSFLEKGHEVTVLTGLPNYPDGDLLPEFKKNSATFSEYHGAKIIRIPHILRGKSKFHLVMNYLTFVISASILGIWKLRKNNFDVIFVFAVSPITMAIPAIFLGKLKRIPIFLWVQDLWPETLSAVGVIKSPFLLKLVGHLVRWIYEKCDYILMQSRAFLPSIAAHCSTAHKEGKVLYFPNWAEPIFSQNNDASEAYPTSLQRDDHYFTILFAGNIGDAQDFPAILDAAEKIKGNLNIRWIIVGDGRAFDWVYDEVSRRGLTEQVKLMGRFPVEAMPEFFSAADVLLVTLKSDDIFSRTVPGKLQSYLAAGKPILGMLDGEARAIVDESGAGMSCASGDSTQLAQCALRMSTLMKEELIVMGEKGRQYYQLHFDRDTLMTKLEHYFQLAISSK